MTYGDDLLILNESQRILRKTKSDLGSKFHITDLGKVEHFLGIRFELLKNKKSMKLTLAAYVERTLSRFGMS